MEHDVWGGMRPGESQQPGESAGTAPQAPNSWAGGGEAPGSGAGYPPAYPGAQPPQWGAAAPPSGYGAGYPGGQYPQPGYPASPTNPMNPGYPAYPGQAAPPSQGWPAPGTPGYPPQPGYGWPAGPSVPYGYTPGGVPPAPPRKRLSAGAIIGLVALVLVIGIAGATGALLALSPHGGASSAVTNQTPATPTVQATATLAGYDFKDSLNGATNAGWSTDQYCFFKNGAYHANPGSDYSALYCAAPAGSFSDFDMHVTVSEVAGPLNYGYGLTMRHDADGSFYVFVVSSDGSAWFDKLTSWKITHLSDVWQPTHFARGLNAQNTIRVVASGSSFTFYVNGEQVGQATDSTYPRGTVGLFSGDSNLDAAFTNFEVRGTP